ncbi:hypothetical protein D3C75_1097000 [compost metagenome]
MLLKLVRSRVSRETSKPVTRECSMKPVAKFHFRLVWLIASLVVVSRPLPEPERYLYWPGPIPLPTVCT